MKRAKMPVFYFLNQDMVLAKKHNKNRLVSDIPRPPKDAALDRKQADPKDLVWELAEPICTVEGMELVHVEFQWETGGRVLRLYVDKPGGIMLDDCSAVSSQLGDILDLKLDIDDPYTLEISSPGLNRPVSKLSDFEKFKGKLAKIKIARPINGQKNFKGILAGVNGSDIQLKTETDMVVIPYQDIIKTRLVIYDGDNKCL
jgi:ribosome maturation factor RimP